MPIPLPIPNGYIRFKMGGLAPLYRGTDRSPNDDVFINGWKIKTGLIDIKNHLLKKYFYILFFHHSPL